MRTEAKSRLDELFDNLFGVRFLVLYGNAVEDIYFAPMGGLQAVEEALQGSLLRAGFEQVHFLSAHRGIHSLPQEGEHPHEAITPTPQGDISEHMEFFTGGPLGDRQLIPAKQSMTTSSQRAVMGDTSAIRILDAILTEPATRSAVIITQAETTLTYFDDHRTLAGLVGQWLRLPPQNANLVVFLFSANNREDLRRSAHHIPVPELRTSLLAEELPEGGAVRVECLPVPGLWEIRCLIDHFRKFGTPVNLQESDELARRIGDEGQILRHWFNLFQKAEQLDLDTANRSGWFRAVRVPGSRAWEDLLGLVGLAMIKERMKELAAWWKVEIQRNSEPGTSELQPALNMVFSGSPGTGKTTTARMIGEIFHEVGILKRGHLVEVHASDLVGETVGSTGAKTTQVIERALDGVLFIDEAYMLTSEGRGGFGLEALETLLARMDGCRGRMVVIVAGYPEKMEQFLRANPGLSRRFPAENRFTFPNFSKEELLAILYSMLRQRGLFVIHELSTSLERIVYRLAGQGGERFGNAGEMRNLADALARKHAARVISHQLPLNSPLTVADIPEHYRRYLGEAEDDLDGLFEELNNLTGLQEIKLSLRRQVARIHLEKERQSRNPTLRRANLLQHMLFLGPPGTGKTTVARLVGRMYRRMGMLRLGHCVEVSRADLVAGYVGQTAIATRQLVEKALDGILFIDEAYALARDEGHGFGQEAIDTLVKLMDEYNDRLVVIAAGYPAEMEQFLKSNSGLVSRFPLKFLFRPFTPRELEEILCKRALTEQFILPAEVAEAAVRQAITGSSFHAGAGGNARTILQIYEKMKDNLALRVVGFGFTGLGDRSTEELSTFQMEDVPAETASIPLPMASPDTRDHPSGENEDPAAGNPPSTGLQPARRVTSNPGGQSGN